MKPFCFVAPRYGEFVAGGAETLMREFAERLAVQYPVEVLTTTAKDNRTWAPELPPGVTVERGVRVHRFSVDERDLETWVPLQIRVAENMLLSIEEQIKWWHSGVNSTPLYDYIRQNAERYRALYFGPYLFGTTFFGSLVAPEKSVLIPCLHDESYAYLETVASMFRQVRGVMWNALPEQELGAKIFGEIRGSEVGMGFVPPSADYVAALTPYFSDKFPYLFYVGRKELGKNVHLLIDDFVSLKATYPELSKLKLVLAGPGSQDDLHRKEAFKRDDIIDLGKVSEIDKSRLIKFASTLVQPSVNESFSIVIMESWMLGTPVIVHGHCNVTRHHALESNGGLYYDSTAEFCEVVKALISDTELAAQLGANGCAYVAQKYSWDATLKRFHRLVDELCPLVESAQFSANS